ncbi:MAG: hypothetical protein JJU02_02125 [Cryomorphaceae bacterium]|nr:hypothetical protein [Cryomorphaceae bacterium]
MKIMHGVLRTFLSLLLVLSTGGFSTYAHFCKGEMVAGSVIIPADPCEKMAEKSCSQKKHQEGFTPNCCESDIHFFQTAPTKHEEVQPDFQIHNQQAPALFVNIVLENRNAICPDLKIWAPPKIPLYILLENFRL